MSPKVTSESTCPPLSPSLPLKPHALSYGLFPGHATHLAHHLPWSTHHKHTSAICSLLSIPLAKNLVQATTLSHLGYHKDLLIGLSPSGLAHPQPILHVAVRMSLLKCDSDHVKTLLKPFSRSPLPQNEVRILQYGPQGLIWSQSLLTSLTLNFFQFFKCTTLFCMYSLLLLGHPPCFL